MGVISISKETLIKTILILLFFISLISCKEMVQGPDSNEAPLNTVWSLTPPPAVYPYNASGLNITVTNNAYFSTIRYTTNGIDPTIADNEYTGAINITVPTTIKFAAFTDGIRSAVYSAYYTFKLPQPTFTPPGGLYNANQNVVLTDPTGAVIRYTTNGSTPNSGSSVYAAAIPVGSNFPIKAYSSNIGLGYVDSDVATHNYVIMIGKFVKTTGNDTTGDGSPGNPYATIQKGITQAGASGTVYVAAGTYNEDITMTAFNTIIKGGYNPSNWTDRNYEDRTNPTYKTEIVAASSRAFTLSNCNVTIEGFTIRGGIASPASSMGIAMSGGSPTIIFNSIGGGNGTATSDGINISGSASPTIIYNYISGGGGPSANTGIKVNGVNSPIIRQNLIYGSLIATNNSYAIYLTGGAAAISIINNLIFGGYGTTAYGIYIATGGAQIFNNTISTGSNVGGTTSTGIYLSGLTATTITNNVIFRDGVTPADYSMDYVSGVMPVTSYNTYAIGTPLHGGLTNGTGDIQAPVVLDANKKPTATSDPSILSGGTDLSGLFTVDIQNNPRSIPWSRGCYEY